MLVIVNTSTTEIAPARMVSNQRACHGTAPLGLFDGALPFGEAVLMMELPKRYSTPLEGGAGSHPLIVQTMVGVH